MKSLLTSLLAFAVTVAPLQLSAAQSPRSASKADGTTFQHVLLISVDGMHSLDFQNCASGLPGVNNGAPYCPNLAAPGYDWYRLHERHHFEALRLVPWTHGDR